MRPTVIGPARCAAGITLAEPGLAEPSLQFGNELQEKLSQITTR
jgi:hypothetical protein